MGNDLATTLAIIQQKHHQGASALKAAHAISLGYRHLVLELFAGYQWNNRLALLATGGFGRGEMAPHSDIDLLFLLDEADNPEAIKEPVTALLHRLWDLNIDLSYAIRTPSASIELAGADYRVLTALMDALPIAGDLAFGKRFLQEFNSQLFSKQSALVREFIRQAEISYDQRHQRYGDSVYLLEPHIKEGQGGLRDFQLALWMLHAACGRSVRIPRKLQRLQMIAAKELQQLFARDLEFVWYVRHSLHFLAGRRMDLLNFAMQEAVAEQMGYGRSRDGIAQFMTDYYGATRNIQRFSGSIVRSLAQKYRLAESSKRQRQDKTIDREGAFAVRGCEIIFSPRLALKKQQQLPVKATLAPFELFLRQQANFSAEVRRFVRHMAVEQGHRLAGKTFGNRLLHKVLCSDRVYETLNTMHALGVLRLLLPEFGNIEHLFQRDLYHIYTVDIHSLMAVKTLEVLRQKQLAPQYPLLTELMLSLEQPRRLYLAALLHDSGKGSGKPHAVVGRRYALQVGRRLGWSKTEVQELVFLVQHHLLLPHISEKQDIFAPEVITALGRRVKTVARLRQLLLLTFADQRSVGPRGYSKWKHSLLLQLYKQTERFLIHKQLEDKKVRTQRLARHRFADEPKLRTFLSKLPEDYFRYVTVREIRKHHDLYLKVKRQEPAVLVQGRPKREGLRIIIAAKDRPGLFSIIAGAMALTGFNILIAQLFTTSDGVAIDLFEVEGDAGNRAAVVGKLQETIRQATTKTLDIGAALKKQRSTLATKPTPKIPTKVSIHNRENQTYTVVEVVAADRPALLYQISQIFADLNLNIYLARINTEAERVSDTFFLTPVGAEISTARQERDKWVRQLRRRLQRMLGGQRM